MEHFVHLYQETRFLADAVAEYLGESLSAGAAAIVIATPAHRAAFLEKLDAEPALREGRLKLLDAEQALARLVSDGMPQWQPFQEMVGAMVGELCARHPAVRAYGEMVDLLWQKGRRDAALRLEGYWNELGKVHAFSLFCAYRMDPLDSQAYGGPLESVCHAHSQLMPARDPERFDQAVHAATLKVLEQPLAQMLLALAARHRAGTRMSAGQATLFWLQRNMPRTAEKIFRELRAGRSPAT
jgi:MEDS: MEthanogen/methylotroph, DcmR Sensory domain